MRILRLCGMRVSVVANSNKSPGKRRFNLPLALTLGGMITLGITTTTLGFLLMPEPKAHEDTSTEGWPEVGPNWSTTRRSKGVTKSPQNNSQPPVFDAGVMDAL